MKYVVISMGDGLVSVESGNMASKFLRLMTKSRLAKMAARVV
jgi:hypothetical protein